MRNIREYFIEFLYLFNFFIEYNVYLARGKEMLKILNKYFLKLHKIFYKIRSFKNI